MFAKNLFYYLACVFLLLVAPLKASITLCFTPGYLRDFQIWDIDIDARNFHFETTSHFCLLPVSIAWEEGPWSLRVYGAGGIMLNTKGADSWSDALGPISVVERRFEGSKAIAAVDIAYHCLSAWCACWDLALAAGWRYEYTRYPGPTNYTVREVNPAVPISFTFSPGGAYVPVFKGPLVGLDVSYHPFPCSGPLLSRLSFCFAYRIGCWDFRSESFLNGGILIFPGIIIPNGSRYKYSSRIDDILIHYWALNGRYALSPCWSLFTAIEVRRMNAPKGTVALTVDQNPSFTNAICQAISNLFTATAGFCYSF